jgi:hypothetical protein
MTDAHIVIEDGVLAAIQLQEALCICYSEILKVQQAMRDIFPNQLDKPGKTSE